MIHIPSALVKELRQRTGVGIMECKKALIAENGNIELAIDNMRKSGKAKAAKKAGQTTDEGIILAKIAYNGKYGIIIELNCETDFVSKDDYFKSFGQDVINTALNEYIIDINLLQSKFEDQRTLLVNKIGENIKIRRVGVLTGNILSVYLHCSRIGVIVSAEGTDKEIIKSLAMHIAASKPEYLNIQDIPKEILAREHQIQLDIAMQSGKSYEMARKIVEGRMLKFTNTIVLNNQNYILDQNKIISQILKEHDVQINNFIRFEVGEGLAK